MRRRCWKIISINAYERLIERVETEKVDAMIEDSKQQTTPPAAPAPEPAKPTLDEPLAEECTIDDFMKADLRIAKVLKASAVEGADKLLSLELDLGGITRHVFAASPRPINPKTSSNGWLSVSPTSSPAK
jgi:methionyl-tRNA synthetase